MGRLSASSPRTTSSVLPSVECRQLSVKLFLQGKLNAKDIIRWCVLNLNLSLDESGEEGCRFLIRVPNIPESVKSVCLYYLSLFLLRQGKFSEVLPLVSESLASLLRSDITPRPPAPPQAIMSQDSATTLLLETLVKLRAGGVHAYAHAGSLLGLVRDGKVLPFDKDLDIGLMEGELPKAHNVLQACGWKQGNSGVIIRNMPSYKHSMLGITLDLCGMRRDNNNRLWGGFVLIQNPASEWRRDTSYPSNFELKEIETEYGRIWQITDPEAWLENIYGPTWRTPDKGFDTVIAANNLQGFSKLTEWFAYSKVIRPWSYGHLDKAYRMCEQVIEKHQLSGTCFNKAATHLAYKLNANTELA